MYDKLSGAINRQQLFVFSDSFHTLFSCNAEHLTVSWSRIKMACVQTLLAGLGSSLGKEKMSRCAKRAGGGGGGMGRLGIPPSAHFAQRLIFSLPKLDPQTRKESLHAALEKDYCFMQKFFSSRTFYASS